MSDLPEVVVSYETIFDMLRKEKNRADLQPLPEGFIKDVSDYLQAKKTLLHKGFDADTPVEEKQKLMLHIQNMKKLLKELHDRRETKLLHLAQNKVRTGNVLIDKDSMLSEEERLFETLCEALEGTRKSILTQMTEGAKDHHLFEATYSGMGEAPSSSIGSSSVESVQEEVAIEQTSVVAESSLITLRFLQDVPKFVGRDLQVYGPYKSEDIASIPKELAHILLDKDRAEEVQISL